MSRKVYEEICQIVYEQCGINLGEKKHALVHGRLGKRLRALGLQCYEDYLEFLLEDESGDEIVQLLDVISTNHTHFFREPTHFEFLQEVLQKKLKAGNRKFRIWCAAASSGEEPYTLSMVAQEACLGYEVDLRILATDISTKVLRQCLKGEYEEQKMAGISADLRKKWWKKIGDDLWSAKASLRKPLTFTRLNLMESPYPMSGPFDVVFCRNVMIYFDIHGRQKVISEAQRLLGTNDILIVGHSESLNGINHDFKMIKPSVYQRNY
ncbi:MAG: chemotaxis protein CheR [Fibrobacter sp.]|nr:chemotaxis protein CheR [Fibrobacter sp.]